MPSCNAPWRSLSIRALVGWHTIPVHDRCLHFFLQSLRTSVAIRLSRPGPQKHSRVVSERARDGGTRRHGWAAGARAEWQRCLQHVLRILRGTSLRSIRRGGASGTQALPIQLRHAPRCAYAMLSCRAPRRWAPRSKWQDARAYGRHRVTKLRVDDDRPLPRRSQARHSISAQHSCAQTLRQPGVRVTFIVQRATPGQRV